MNYVKRSLSALLIAGLLSTQAQALELNQIPIRWKPLAYSTAVVGTALGAYCLLTKATEEMKKKQDTPEQYSKIKEDLYGYSGLASAFATLLLLLSQC